MARKNVTPAEIEAAYQDQKARLPIISEADQLAATVVALPASGSVAGPAGCARCVGESRCPIGSRGRGSAVRPAAPSTTARRHASAASYSCPWGSTP